MNLGLPAQSNIEITNEDVITGFEIFSAMIYCPESTMKMYRFFHSLLTTQSPRTIIQATVNTIQADDINEKVDRKMLNNLYHAIDKIFHFKLGSILLATASPLQLQAMMAKDWPYFNPYLKEIDQCVTGVSCQGVRDIVQTLGKTTILMLTLCFLRL